MDAVDHGWRHVSDRSAANLCTTWRVGAGVDAGSATIAGHGNWRGMGWRSIDDQRVSAARQAWVLLRMESDGSWRRFRVVCRDIFPRAHAAATLS